MPPYTRAHQLYKSFLQVGVGGVRGCIGIVRVAPWCRVGKLNNGPFYLPREQPAKPICTVGCSHCSLIMGLLETHPGMSGFELMALSARLLSSKAASWLSLYWNFENRHFHPPRCPAGLRRVL